MPKTRNGKKRRKRLCNSGVWTFFYCFNLVPVDLAGRSRLCSFLSFYYSHGCELVRAWLLAHLIPHHPSPKKTRNQENTNSAHTPHSTPCNYHNNYTNMPI